MEREFNACQTPRSMYPSIFNRFPVIQAASLKVRYVSTFLHILASPVYAHGTIAVDSKCYMDGKRIQCWSNASQHVPIYLQPFTSYSEILVGNCDLFLPLAFSAPVGGVPIGIQDKVETSEN